MSLAVPLTPELEAQLTADAARVGVSPEQLAAGVLAAHLPADRRTAAVALLDSWLADPDPSDQKAAGDALVEGLDTARSGQRPHFPPAAEGRTW